MSATVSTSLQQCSNMLADKITFCVFSYLAKPISVAAMSLIEYLSSTQHLNSLVYRHARIEG